MSELLFLPTWVTGDGQERAPQGGPAPWLVPAPVGHVVAVGPAGGEGEEESQRRTRGVACRGQHGPEVMEGDGTGPPG